MRLALRPSILAVVLVVAGLPAVAEAQIYVWHDAAGNLVLSDKPKDPSAKTYSVPAAANTTVATTGLRTTNAMSARTAQRAAQYERLIEENAAAHGVSPHLVRAVIQQESGFIATARSHKGAMGLMQLMPATAAELGVSDPYDPSENIRAGVQYLKGLLVKFAQNVELALAAYNAGPTAVTRYGTVPPYRETRDYVTRITTAVDAAPKPKKIYRTIEIVNGRPIPRYSTAETPGAELITIAPGKR
ncbi:MAG TPA: lytic transglycosylase domain-containing protein [Vicinamibacterales bacterium]|jgi:soluble lytic murein transglycosylase-like protein